MSFAITEDQHILHIRLSGHLDNDQLLNMDKELFDKWNSDKIKGHIYDYRDATSVSFDEDEIKSIAILDTNESFIVGQMKIAIVATDPDVLHFSRIYMEHMQNSDWDVEIFSTLEQAVEFCNGVIEAE